MTTIKMTNKARKAAKNLAIAYSAYVEAGTAVAIAREDNTLTYRKLNTLVVWSNILADAMEKVGITDMGANKPNTLRLFAANRALEMDDLERRAA